MPEERPAAWGVHELCALMGSFCLGLFPWSRPRFPFRSRAPFFPALSTPLPGSRSRVLSSHGHGRSSSRRSLAAGRGLMQMTLTAVKEVILQLIERRRVPRQSVPFDTRPGARYSPWPEPEPRLLAGNTVNVCTLASPSTFPALIIFIPRNLGTERSIAPTEWKNSKPMRDASCGLTRFHGSPAARLSRFQVENPRAWTDCLHEEKLARDTGIF